MSSSKPSDDELWSTWAQASAIAFHNNNNRNHQIKSKGFILLVSPSR
jgi:hypothetical protein